MRLLHTLIAVTALLLSLASPPALACSCSWIYPNGTPLLSDGSPVPSFSALADQPFLFLGTVESVSPIPTGSPEGDKMFAKGLATVLRVDHVWRGVPQYLETITVYTGFPGGGCGYLFRVGQCYLVFAEVEADGMLRTSICTRTTPWDRAGELLSYVYAFLGPPRPSLQELLEAPE